MRRVAFAELALGVLLIPLFPAGAGGRFLSPPVHDSLEWLSISATGIGIYSTRQGTAERGPAWSRFTTPAVLDTALKGTPPAEMIWKSQAGTNRAEAPKPGTRLLVFHDYSARRLKFDRFEELPDAPSTRLIGYDSKGKGVESAAEALSLIESVLAAQERRRSFLTERCMGTGVVIKSPRRSEATRNHSGTTYLVVPLNRSHKRQLLGMARGRERAELFGSEAGKWMAARILCRCYRTDISDILLEMLHSDWSTVRGDSVVIYPARQFAYRMLREQGVDVDVPGGFREDEPAPDDERWEGAIHMIDIIGYLPMFKR